MGIIICEKHGRQPGEEVSKFLRDEFRNGHDISKRIRDFLFVMDDCDFPFYGLQEEIEQLPEPCVNGNFIVQSDERLVEVLGGLAVMCLSCLKEAMNGAPLPVKESGS